MARQSYKTCVVGDPSLLTSVYDVRKAIKAEADAFPSCLAINISDALYEKLRTAETTTDYEIHSDRHDESFFSIGDISDIKGTLTDLIL